jgi:hypothetical protein
MAAWDPGFPGFSSFDFPSLDFPSLDSSRGQAAVMGKGNSKFLTGHGAR